MLEQGPEIPRGSGAEFLRVVRSRSAGVAAPRQAECDAATCEKTRRALPVFLRTALGAASGCQDMEKAPCCWQDAFPEGYELVGVSSARRSNDWLGQTTLRILPSLAEDHGAGVSDPPADGRGWPFGGLYHVGVAPAVSHYREVFPEGLTTALAGVTCLVAFCRGRCAGGFGRAA